jgi:hypothetical protein
VPELVFSLSSAGPVASATADNWNRRTDKLTFPAPVNYNRCTSRIIALNGRYEWLIYYQFLADPWGHPAKSRILPLRGRYRWLDCISTYSPNDWTQYYYMHRSWIRNQRTGGEVSFSQKVSEGGYGHGNGWYEWGTRLIHR